MTLKDHFKPKKMGDSDSDVIKSDEGNDNLEMNDIYQRQVDDIYKKTMN